MAEQLPVFPYHRDPIGSGSLIETDERCECCGKARVFIYTGVVYSPQSVSAVCPWCIADGSASAKFDASFFDAYFCDEHLNHVEQSSAAHHAVFNCTIGFSCFNPIGWWVHCDEPAEFVFREEPYDLVFECRVCKKRHVIEDLD